MSHQSSHFAGNQRNLFVFNVFFILLIIKKIAWVPIFCAFCHIYQKSIDIARYLALFTHNFSTDYVKIFSLFLVKFEGTEYEK